MDAKAAQYDQMVDYAAQVRSYFTGLPSIGSWVV